MFWVRRRSANPIFSFQVIRICVKEKILRAESKPINEVSNIVGNEIKILIGGSPCTHWSIAKGKTRETTSEGLGWELFKNFLKAKERFKPDYFLYENVSSASKDIKAEIYRELSKDDADKSVRLTDINSALLSAQNRKRFYVTNFGDISQPEDRGIMLKDILEGNKNISLRENKYESNSYSNRPKTAVKVGILPNKKGEVKDSQANRIYKEDGKSVALQARSGGLGAKTGLYSIRVGEECFKDTDKKQLMCKVENG